MSHRTTVFVRFHNSESVLKYCSNRFLAVLLVIAMATTNSNLLAHAASIPHCKEPGKTILSVTGKNSSDAKLFATTMFADLEAECKRRDLLGMEETIDECVDGYKKEGYLHEKISVTANCNSGYLEIDGNSHQLPKDPLCVTGGHLAYEVFNRLCPTSKNKFKFSNTQYRYPFVCRSVGATIFEISGQNSSDAKMSGLTTMSDIELACEDGSVTQGTMNKEQCVHHFRSQGLLHDEFSASADCRTSTVTIDGHTSKLTDEISCSNGNLHTIEAIKLLCPNKNIGVTSSKISEVASAKIYQTKKRGKYQLVCHPNHLELKEQSKNQDRASSLYFSESCGAYHTKLGRGVWEWANGGFGADLEKGGIWFPRSEIVCDPEPGFIDACRGPIEKHFHGYVVDTCSLRYLGNNFIKGKCSIQIDEDGTFHFDNLSKKPHYFVAVFMDDNGVGKGWWNGETADSHAHYDLGKLKQRGNCWFNQTTEICFGSEASRTINAILSDIAAANAVTESCVDYLNNTNVTREFAFATGWVNRWKRNTYEMQRLLKKYGAYRGKIDGDFGKNSKNALCQIMKTYIAIGGTGSEWGIRSVSDAAKFVDWLAEAVEAIETGGEYPD